MGKITNFFPKVKHWTILKIYNLLISSIQLEPGKSADLVLCENLEDPESVGLVPLDKSVDLDLCVCLVDCESVDLVVSVRLMDGVAVVPSSASLSLLSANGNKPRLKYIYEGVL